MPVLVGFLVLPFGPNMIIRDMNIGVLLIFAFSTFTVLAILAGGWASNNKYALLGAMRSVAQNVAYEIPLLLSVMSVVLMVHSLSFSEIVNAQHSVWFIFLQPVAGLIYLISATAETNRAPFDIPEAESELVAGFHTEYSGMGFGLFFLAEYTNMFIVSAVATSLFFGGWHGPLRDKPWHTRGLLVPLQNLRADFRHHVGALDFSAGPVRPVDEFFVEGDDPD